jgi:hypothetical protein
MIQTRWILLLERIFSLESAKNIPTQIETGYSRNMDQKRPIKRSQAPLWIFFADSSENIRSKSNIRIIGLEISTRHEYLLHRYTPARGQPLLSTCKISGAQSDAEARV